MTDRYAKYKPIYDEWIKLYPFQLEDLPGEVWRIIPAFEDYQGSNFGRVKSFKRKEPYIMKPSLNNKGYLAVMLWKSNKGKHFLVSRLAAQLFIPNPQGFPEVDHISGVHFDNSVWNLRWVTGEENRKYAVETGLVKSGEEAPQAKLTNEQVLYIRENPDNLSCVRLAEEFGVCKQTITNIQLGIGYQNAGGTVRGKQQCPRRIPDEKRNQIRELYQTGEYLQRELAQMFSVSLETVRRSIKGRR